MKVIVRYCKAKLGWGNIFKPRNGNDSLFQDSIKNYVRMVNFVTSKNLVVKSKIFTTPNHSYIHLDHS